MNGDVVLLNSCLARGACADITFRDGVIHEIGDTEATGGTPKSDRENAAIDPLIDFRYAPNSGHSEAHAGLPVMTQQRHLVHPESEAKGNHFGPAFKLEAEHATQTGGPVLISPAVWASLIGT